MTNYKVTVLRDRNNPGSKMVVNILANSPHEAREQALSMYGANGKVIAVV
ncbi:hypothetical protein [Paraburkholderia tropica]|nr:hypothetical protein [Paraburkholderia tropica]